MNKNACSIIDLSARRSAQKGMNMKKRIAILLLAGICLTNAAPCYAAQSAKVSVVGSDGVQYTTLPDAKNLKKDVEFEPKVTAKLAGGYKFDEGNITESFDLDKKGAAVNKRKGISFRYEKKEKRSTKSVTLSAEPVSDQSFTEDAVLTEYGEVDIYYSDVQGNSVSWIDGEIFYMLMDIDKKVTEDELIKMAKGMIDLDSSSSAKK